MTRDIDQAALDTLGIRLIELGAELGLPTPCHREDLAGLALLVREMLDLASAGELRVHPGGGKVRGGHTPEMKNLAALRVFHAIVEEESRPLAAALETAGAMINRAPGDDLLWHATDGASVERVLSFANAAVRVHGGGEPDQMTPRGDGAWEYRGSRLHVILRRVTDTTAVVEWRPAAVEADR